MRLMIAGLVATSGLLVSPVFAETLRYDQSALSVSVPRIVNLTGEFRPADGGQPASVETVTVGIYAGEKGGVPLWQETQSVAIDSLGFYTVLLGTTERDGVPLHVFGSGEGLWLDIQWARAGEAPSARTRLASVPFALKAADAETLGGFPASAFQLAWASGGQIDAANARAGAAGPAVGAVPKVVNPGTTNYVAKYVTAADVGNSALYEVGGFLGVNTTAPQDVITARFTSTDGALTGLAVQNLGATATSYSGMLFYDQTGAVAQFQGFNNSTHEYRINNIATSGSINFMLGGTSMLQVAAGGNVGIGVAPTQKLSVAGSVAVTGGNVAVNGGEFRPLGTTFYGMLWVDGSGNMQAHMHRFGAVDNRLYVTNNGGGDLTGVYLASAATSWTSTSDERLKTDIEPVTGILDKIRDIRVVGFNMASLGVDEASGKAVVKGVPKRTMKNGTVIRQQIGSIAQDWIANFPELVVEPETADGYYGLDYDRIGVVALGAVKELSSLVAQKDAQIKALTERLERLEMVQRLGWQAER